MILGKVTGALDDPPTHYNGIYMYDNVGQLGRNQLLGQGPWTIFLGGNKYPSGNSSFGDEEARQVMPEAVFQGTLWVDQPNHINVTTGRLETNWVEYRGQRGAYVE
jgi:hypothetical protein